MQDFLKALLYVNGYLRDGEDFSTFMTYCEPAIDVWSLEKKDDMLIVKIKTYEDERKIKIIENNQMLFSYDEFVKSIINGLTQVIKTVGLYGYYKKMGYEFPLSLYLKLAIIFEKKDIDSNSLNEDVSFQQELNILNDLMKK